MKLSVSREQEKNKMLDWPPMKQITDKNQLTQSCFVGKINKYYIPSTRPIRKK